MQARLWLRLARYLAFMRCRRNTVGLRITVVCDEGLEIELLARF